MAKFFRVCLTGGPGAGKTSIADLLRRESEGTFVVAPETATILYGGGFPRPRDAREQKLVQSAIYNVQIRSEAFHFGRMRARKERVLVCDRGTLDSCAYWPGGRTSFLRAQGTTLEKEFSRYDLVVHLESASVAGVYDLSNPVRTESASEAQRLDRKIREAYRGHPKTVFIPSRASFLEKSEEVLALLRSI